MKDKFLKTKKQFGKKRIVSIFDSFQELKEYCEKRYNEIEKHIEFDKKLSKYQVIELHKEYIFGENNSLKQLKELAKFRWNIEISRMSIKRYFDELDLPKFRSKKQRKHLKSKETVSDDKIPQDAIVIDDTHKTIFPVRNKYRGIINKNKETIVDILDKKSGVTKRLKLSLEENKKKRQIKMLVKMILEKTDRVIAIDGELANKKDDVFGNNRVKRYECKYIGSKESGNTPISENYQKGESQHLGLKEGVYNMVDLLNISGENKGEIKEKFKEKLNKIYESKLDSYPQVKKWIKQLD